MSEENAKSKVIEDFKLSDNDTGSVEVQVALCTKRINELTEHFKTHPKDFHSKRGMMRIINNRKKLLNYLKTESYDRYSTLIQKLGIRK